jgi:hypothetical protein
MPFCYCIHFIVVECLRTEEALAAGGDLILEHCELSYSFGRCHYMCNFKCFCIFAVALCLKCNHILTLNLIPVLLSDTVFISEV